MPDLPNRRGARRRILQLAINSKILLIIISLPTSSSGSGIPKISKDIMFKPGTAYYYSANGFNLVKEVMEEVTEESFEELAQRLVFKPIGMKSSSFVRQDKLVQLAANGHLHALIPILLFGILFTPLFVIVLLIGKIIVRLAT